MLKDDPAIRLVLTDPKTEERTLLHSFIIPRYAILNTSYRYMHTNFTILQRHCVYWFVLQICQNKKRNYCKYNTRGRLKFSFHNHRNTASPRVGFIPYPKDHCSYRLRIHHYLLRKTYLLCVLKTCNSYLKNG